MKNSSQVSGVRYQVKGRPILFSTPMVQAILEGRKIQTRRIVKTDHEALEEVIKVPRILELEDDWGKFRFTWECGDDAFVESPYGKVGDILWVRETWFPSAIIFDRILLGYKASFNDAKTIEITTSNTPFYWKKLNKGKMIPSIHMPKEAARIWLEITDIRVERLQDISQQDAIKEGVVDYEDGYFKNYFTQKHLRESDGVKIFLATSSFQSLWCSINGLDSWELNPWVWVVCFNVLSKTGRPEFLKT